MKYVNELFTGETQMKITIWKKYSNVFVIREIKTTKYHLKWIIFEKKRKLDNATCRRNWEKQNSHVLLVDMRLAGTSTIVHYDSAILLLSIFLREILTLNQKVTHLLLCCLWSGIEVVHEKKKKKKVNDHEIEHSY